MNLDHLPLGWVDLALLTILAVSVLVGLWRGFTFEIVSLLGWLVAFVIANSLGPVLAPVLPFGDPTSPFRLWVAYGVVFLLVLVACTLLARMLRALISATPLSFVDRLLGGAFGVVRGSLILVIVATLVVLSPFAHAPAWQASNGSLWLGDALDFLKPVLPAALNDHVLSSDDVPGWLRCHGSAAACRVAPPSAPASSLSSPASGRSRMHKARSSEV